MHKGGWILACLVAIGTASGCTSEDDVGPPSGLAGLSVTDGGDYVVELFVCNGTVGAVDIVRDRQGTSETDENTPVQRYTSSRPRTGLVTLDVSRPEAGWTPSSPTVFEAGKGFIVTGEGGNDNETSQLNIRTSALSGLAPGFVYVNDDASSSRLSQLSHAEFTARAKTACDSGRGG